MFDPSAMIRELFDRSWADLHGSRWDHDEELQYPGVYLLAYTDERLVGLSSDAKRNTPCRFAIGLVDQDLRECCHARLFASAG